MSRVSRWVFLAGIFTFSAVANSIEIGMYNVQNLFDVSHDEGKRDYEFLPLENRDRIRHCEKVLDRPNPSNRSRAVRNCRNPIDWDTDKVAMKIETILRVFRTRNRELRRTGLPDVLMLSEVENETVVAQLARSLGYDRWMVTAGTDRRGIDLAFLYNEAGTLRFVSSRVHNAHVGFATRPIFETEFRIKGRSRAEGTLFLYANHWPSQISKTSEPRMRAARSLRSIMQARADENPSGYHIAMGDFNVVDGERPHPFDNVLLNAGRNELQLADVHTAYERAVARRRIRDRNLPDGTFYYSRMDRWSLFDRFFVSRNLLNGRGYDVNLSEYDIFDSPEISYYPNDKVGWAPKRYNHRATRFSEAGYSDHYPVFMSIERN